MNHTEGNLLTMQQIRAYLDELSEQKAAIPLEDVEKKPGLSQNDKLVQQE